MATFSGGEEIVGALFVQTTAQFATLSYTVPNGNYAKCRGNISQSAGVGSMSVGSHAIGITANGQWSGNLVSSNSTSVFAGTNGFTAFSGETITISSGGQFSNKRLEVLLFNNP